MMDYFVGSPLTNRHVQSIEHNLGLEIDAHRPSHDPPGEGIEHNGEIE
jgi:hypothetical protein